jgi:hypothetical protein
MTLIGLPEGLQIVRLDPKGSRLAPGEYLLEDDLVVVVRCAPGFQMAQMGDGGYRPVRIYDQAKRLELSFDGFSMTFEIANEAQDEALRETLEHFRHKLMTRLGLAEVFEPENEGVYS